MGDVRYEVNIRVYRKCPYRAWSIIIGPFFYRQEIWVLQKVKDIQRVQNGSQIPTQEVNPGAGPCCGYMTPLLETCVSCSKRQAGWRASIAKNLSTRLLSLAGASALLSRKPLAFGCLPSV